MRDMELERLRRPISVAEYQKIFEAGIIGPDERTELLAGEIVRKVTIGNRHRGAVNRLTRMLVLAFQDRAIVQVQGPVVLDDYSQPEPDIALLVDNDAASGARSAYPGDTFAAIEVSDSSLRIDLRVKVPLYAAAGMREVWVVDVRSRIIRVHRDPTPDGYGIVFIARPGQRIAFAEFPDVTFDVAEIVGPEEADARPS